MRKENKKILFVSITAFLLVIGLVLGAVLINLNVFPVGNDITLKINYLDRNYKYSVRSKNESLYEILSDYNEKLALKLYIVEDGGIVITSLKSTDNERGEYRVSVNGEEKGDDIAKIMVASGDTVTIDFISNSVGPEKLAKGGDDAITYYEKISIALYAISAIISIPTIIFDVVSFIKLYQNRHLNKGNG